MMTIAYYLIAFPHTRMVNICSEPQLMYHNIISIYDEFLCLHHVDACRTIASALLCTCTFIMFYVAI